MPDSTPAAIITTTTVAPNEIELPQGILEFFPCNIGTQCSGSERLMGGGPTILDVTECIQFCVRTVANEGLSQVVFEEGNSCLCHLSGTCIISDAPPGEITQVYSKGSDEACP
ncbi:uncharacterized protein LOC131882186 [Tigriopus californicus]|nr:uncharacterized protein LOC131882186 [Tigriopus californicus]